MVRSLQTRVKPSELEFEKCDVEVVRWWIRGSWVGGGLVVKQGSMPVGLFASNLAACCWIDKKEGWVGVSRECYERENLGGEEYPLVRLGDGG